MPRTFSLAEAQALLPAIAPLIEQLQALYASLQANSSRTEELSESVSLKGADDKAGLRVLSAQQLELAETFDALLAQLEGYGCILKDLRQGLVDFYAMRDGKLVFLCWKTDEKRIGYWHSIEEGFAGRQPIDRSKK